MHGSGGWFLADFYFYISPSPPIVLHASRGSVAQCGAVQAPAQTTLVFTRVWVLRSTMYIFLKYAKTMHHSSRTTNAKLGAGRTSRHPCRLFFRIVKTSSHKNRCQTHHLTPLSEKFILHSHLDTGDCPSVYLSCSGPHSSKQHSRHSSST